MTTGSNHPSWKGGRNLQSNGYVKIWNPTHRLADSKGYVLEHRLVWEEFNKASLLPNGLVHHINEVRSDNRPENLQGMTVRTHSMLHHHREDVSKRICYLCGISNEIYNPNNNTSKWYKMNDGFICSICYQGEVRYNKRGLDESYERERYFKLRRMKNNASC